MEQSKINFNWSTIGKEVAAFVRSRAIQSGSFIIYEEKGKIVKEDPRTGQKTIIHPAEKQ